MANQNWKDKWIWLELSTRAYFSSLILNLNLEIQNNGPKFQK